MKKRRLFLGFMTLLSLGSLNAPNANNQVELVYNDVKAVNAVTLAEGDEDDPHRVEDGETVDIPVNVDSAPTIDEILSQITAEDLLGEAVEVECSTEERAKYNPNQLGTYLITVTATDTYGQQATCYLNIQVIDIVAPVVVLGAEKKLEFVPGDSLTAENLKTYFTITDNATDKGGTIGEPTFTLDDSPLSELELTSTDVGSHILKVTVSDSSGNEKIESFDLSVLDKNAPVISRKDAGEGVIKIGLSKVLSMEQQDFLDLFTAEDDIDGDVSDTLAINGDFIENHVGEYTVKLQAHDDSSNFGSLTVEVEVLSDVPPVFILSDALIQATTDSPLSSDQIEKVIVNGIYSNDTVNELSFDDTEYQEGKLKAGTYAVPYQIKYVSAETHEEEEESGILQVDVVGEEQQEEEELDWWSAFCKWWIDGFQCLWNWLCGRGWYTNAELGLE